MKVQARRNYRVLFNKDGNYNALLLTVYSTVYINEMRAQLHNKKADLKELMYMYAHCTSIDSN